MTSFSRRNTLDRERMQTAGAAARSTVAYLQIAAERFFRFEFWPAWILYALLIPHFVRLVIRHRSVTVFAAANPGIPLGGFVGESKFDILRRLPRSRTIPGLLLTPAPSEQRLRHLRQAMDTHRWHFPLVLKPDVGERGTGVRLVRSIDEAADYFRVHHQAVIAQPFHTGPFEAGVFYVRRPGSARGEIFSITTKVLPTVTGDGRSTLRALILSDSVLRLRHAVLLRQLGSKAADVPCAGEQVVLSIVGNHCRGAIFLDGAHLSTSALQDAIDQVARQFDGFHFGRFDIKYSDPTAFARGEGFEIVELNGVLSESTNIYDPSFSLLRALRTLRAQWTLAFEIGAANARRGARIPTAIEMIRAVRHARSLARS
ncbi:MAG: hypothetical protein U0573_04340 [Phycisphaerales bacterium]|nr:carboxylate--amine ligase [Planctomycetota bacterium]